MSDLLPTSRELDALKVIWDLKSATVRQVYERLRAENDALAYTSVLSLMQVMEKKGLVRRQNEGKGKTHVYFATMPAEKTLRGLAGSFLDTVFDGVVSQYMLCALRSRRLTVSELEELELMITEAKRRHPQRKTKRGEP